MLEKYLVYKCTEIIHDHTNNRGDLEVIYKLQLTHALIEEPGEVETEAYHKKKKNHYLKYFMFQYSLIYVVSF